MEGYLGSPVVDVKDTPYKDYTSIDWAMYFVTVYGGFDGAHHKDWVLDQVARCLHGTNIEIKLAQWSNGTKEYRISTIDPPSEKYQEWVTSMLGEFINGEYEYGYDEGCPP